MTGRNQPIRRPSHNGAPKDERRSLNRESLAEETRRVIDEAREEIERSVRKEFSHVD